MTQRMIQRTGIAVGIAALLALQACGTSTVSKGISDDGVASEVVFPAQKDAWLEQGTFPNLENLRRIAPGVTKDQLSDFVGRPHFSEGLGAVREWDYIFHFRTPTGIKTCQYKAIFDKNVVAQSFHWLPTDCADMLKVAAAPLAERAPRIEQLAEAPKLRAVLLPGASRKPETERPDAVTVRRLPGALQSFAVTPTLYFHANTRAAVAQAVGVESVAADLQGAAFDHRFAC